MANRPNIVSLKRAVVDDELVTMLKGILADAESGKLVGICGVCEYAVDDPVFFTRGMDDIYRAAGLLDGLKAFLAEE